MNFFRILLIIFVVLVSTPGWCQYDDISYDSEEDGKAQETLYNGTRLIQFNKEGEALGYFNKAIAYFEEKYRDDKSRFYSARNQEEAIEYLHQIEQSNTGIAKRIPMDWAIAYYFKAYTLKRLKIHPDARIYMERALSFSPQNSRFLSDMGTIYLGEENFTEAMKSFKLAEAAAKKYSPKELKNLELSLALRGMGFTSYGMNRLADAESYYKQTIAINKNDEVALDELKAVQHLRLDPKFSSY